MRHHCVYWISAIDVSPIFPSLPPMLLFKMPIPETLPSSLTHLTGWSVESSEV